MAGRREDREEKAFPAGLGLGLIHIIFVLLHDPSCKASTTQRSLALALISYRLGLLSCLIVHGPENLLHQDTLLNT